MSEIFFFSVAFRGTALTAESVLLRIGRETYEKFYASLSQNRIKKCVYNQSVLDKEGCCRDSDGRMPGLWDKIVCSESTHFA